MPANPGNKTPYSEPRLVWKLQVKRLTSLLRSSKGITVKGHNYYLLDPRDAQDLYRSLDLIELIDAYVKTGLPPTKPLSTIRYRREHTPPRNVESRTRPIPGTDRNIALINDLITSFAWPFITITMGLNEQIKTLSEYSRLVLALFGTSKEGLEGEIKGVKFMPWALYWDTQTTVRDVFIGVAKCQEVDPEGYFFLTSMGKDA